MNDINNIFRGAGIVLFMLILIMDDFPFYKKMKEPYVQLILAIIIVSILLYDCYTGFIFTMVLMLIYYEIYKKINHKLIKNNNNNKINHKDKYILNPIIEERFSEKNKKDINSSVVQLNYITEEHLESAQNNIFNIEKNNNKDIDNDNDNITYTAFGYNGVNLGCINQEYIVKGYDKNDYDYI